MIRGNAMDVYTVAFANGDIFSLMANGQTMACLMAQELAPGQELIACHIIDQWEDDHA
jgi:hypothetical protein